MLCPLDREVRQGSEVAMAIPWRCPDEPNLFGVDAPLGDLLVPQALGDGPGIRAAFAEGPQDFQLAIGPNGGIRRSPPPGARSDRFRQGRAEYGRAATPK